MSRSLSQIAELHLVDPQLPATIKDAALTSGDLDCCRKLKRYAAVLKSLRIELVELLWPTD